MLNMQFGTFLRGSALLPAEGYADIAVVPGSGRNKLALISATNDQLLVLDPAESLKVLDQHALLRSPIGAQASLTIQSQNEILVSGIKNGGLSAFKLEPTGALSVKKSAIPVDKTITEVTAFLEGAFLYQADGTRGISLWQNSQNTQLNWGQGRDERMQLLQIGETTVIASAEHNNLTAMNISAIDQIRVTGQLQSGQDLWIDRPNNLQHATVGAKDFVVLTATKSSSIVIAELLTDGSLQIADQVTDTKATRFSQIQTLEIAQVGQHSFLIVSGTDDGVTLLQILPSGQLVHKLTLPHEAAIPLYNITALSSAVTEETLNLFVATEGRSGISHIGIDLSQLGAVVTGTNSPEQIAGTPDDDVISGKGGDDHLHGGNGDDIVQDGRGQDTLWGGEGDDLFVLTRDGETDVIHDFLVGSDRIDLSGLTALQSTSVISFESFDHGIRIRISGETTEIWSHDGTTIRASDFTSETLFDLDHVTNALPQDGVRLIGGIGADYLQGGRGDDYLNGEATVEAFDIIAGQVFRLYHATLGRAPDRGGHQDWTSQIGAGEISLQQAVQGFVKSTEFQQTYGETTDTAFVTLLYQNVLDRLPDEGGLNNWVTALESQRLTREEVVLGFSESQEFQANTTASSLTFTWAGYQAAGTSSIFRLYQATLDRAPDHDGIVYWTSALADGRTLSEVVGGFVNSVEFQATYGATTDSRFVALLYNNVLDRDPDKDGLKYWTQRLNADATREDVVLGFSESFEFSERSRPNLRAYMQENATDDRLIGTKGEDILFGGWGSDAFEFNATENGMHQIADMEPWDQIYLAQSQFGSSTEVINALNEDGNDLVLHDNMLSLRLIDTSLSDVFADMFSLF